MLLAVLAAAVMAGGASSTPATTSVTVGPLAVSAGGRAAQVAPNFVGLSIEVGAVLRMIGETGESEPLATLLGHFHGMTAGPHAGPTLRFGGNSADDSAWLGDGAAPPDPLPAGISYAITKKDLEAYTTFASRTAHVSANVSLIIDTNFGTSTDPLRFGVPHIKAVVRHPGLLPHVSAVEVGNEMDIYFHEKAGKPHHRNASYTEAEYEKEWANYVQAFEAAGLPMGMVQAATYASASKEWGYKLTALVARWRAHLASVSLHRYATSTCSGTPVTKAELLADEATRGKVDFYRKFIAGAQSAGVPFVIGEGNTASCGGQKGVSDTLTAALWSLDFLPTLSQVRHRLSLSFCCHFAVLSLYFHCGPCRPAVPA